MTALSSDPPRGALGAPPAARRDREDRLAERFLRYSAIASQSDASASTVPTSEGQWELARLLEGELRELGAEDVHLSGTCVLTATIPASTPEARRSAPVIGFCVHLDTVDVGLSPHVRARVVDYAGGVIPLDDAGTVVLDPRAHPEITRYAGDRIIVGDGTSVLGADDKAGIAALMQAVAELLAEDRPEHGEIRLAFVPDEEIGLRGVRTLELDRFGVDFAFTLDSCEIGEVVEATFNAATAVVTIEGVTAHPMNAKGVLVNPILLAARFVGSLDPAETPECTDGTEGYIWVNDIAGGQAQVRLVLSIRDHDRAGYEERKTLVRSLAAQLQQDEPRCSVTVEIEDVYANIADARTESTAGVTEAIEQAMGELGIVPIRLTMRGGTDGSWLSVQGIFTPNFFTGGHNFHSRFEFLPLPSLEASCRMVLALVDRRRWE